MQQEAYDINRLFDQALKAHNAGQVELGRQLFDQLIEQARETGAYNPQLLVMREALFPDAMASVEARWQAIEAQFNEALRTYDEQQDQLGCLDALINLAKVGFYLRNVEKAKGYLDLADELLAKTTPEQLAQHIPEAWASRPPIHQIRRQEVQHLYQLLAEQA